MLDRQFGAVPRQPAAVSNDIEIGLRQLLGFLRRQRKTLILAPAICLALAFVYLVTATPIYTATTTILMDMRRLSLFSQGDVVSEAAMSNAGLETQVQILRSGQLAEAVVRKLGLAEDEDFLEIQPGLIGGIVDFVTGLFVTPAPPPPMSEEIRTRLAVSRLLSGLTATRAGLSLVINVSYSDTDRERAAQVTNAYAAAYVEDQFNAQVATAQRGSEWLQSRLTELRDQVTSQDLTAQEKSAIRATYDEYLQRYTQAVQQQSLPITEARVITSAVRGSQTSPKSLLVLFAATVLGAGIGFCIALARDLLDGAVRTRKQVESATGATFLGYLPLVRLGGFLGRWSTLRRRRVPGENQRFTAGPAHSIVLRMPTSAYTNALRNIKLALDRLRSPEHGTVLGVVSCGSGEGRSTLAANLARLATKSRHVLLIDCDLRNPALSRELAGAKAPGIVQLIAGRVQLSEIIWSDSVTRLQFLPAGAEGQRIDPSEFLTAPALRALLDACRSKYDLVVVDLPPVLQSADVREAAELFDGFLFVVDWGKTNEMALAEASRIDGIEEKIIGVVLNKVHIGALKRYADSSAEIVAGKYAPAGGLVA